MIPLSSWSPPTSRLWLPRFCQLDPESVCDRPLEKPCNDVEPELVVFRFEKGAEEPRPSFWMNLDLAASFPLRHGCTAN